MKLGTFRQRLKIYTLLTTPDGSGGLSATWVLAKYAFASVVRMSAARNFNAAQIYEGVVYEVTLRYDTAKLITNTQDFKFQYNDIDLVIKEIDNINERKNHFTFICSQKKS